MKKMFSSMMEQFMKGMPKVTLWSSEEDKKKMMACGEQMAALCPCMTGKEMCGGQSVTAGDEKKAMAERMMACCGGAKEMMSTFFKKMGSQPDEAEKSEKA
jgi:hypothetical protein